jgi:hypothetical protein
MKTKHEKLMSMSVNEIEFSVRAANVLNNTGIWTIKDLCSITEEQLLDLPNCGRVTVLEIRRALQSLGLDINCLDSPEYLKKRIEQMELDHEVAHGRLRTIIAHYLEMAQCRDSYNDSVKRFDRIMRELA